MKPILFSTPMVKAILAGRKTQTRRIMKMQPMENDFDGPYCFEPTIINKNGEQEPGEPMYGISAKDGEWGIKCPYQPGDILWVRETWTRLYCSSCEWDNTGNYECEPDEKEGCYMYKATHYITGDLRWHSSIHMSREAARIFLRVTNVRAERLQDISGRNVLAEGVDNGSSNSTMGKRWENMQRMAFQELWDGLYKQRGYGWNSNPWLWVIEFKKMDKPV